jgi:hypothetical protein
MLSLARNSSYISLVRRRWLILASYWGFDRRDPDRAGFVARLNQLWAGGGNMVTSGVMATFINAGPGGWLGNEYRQRFGPS